MAKPPTLPQLARTIVRCRACPRLVAWREEVAREKVARFRDCEYWGRPVPGFGDPSARILVVGLAPGAHGANRTGRVFTGDRSGDFLYAALHRAGLASRATSRWRDDGLTLNGVYITAAVRCAPPANKPLPDEIARCAHYLDEEIALLTGVRVFLALGAIAWRALLDHASRAEIALPRPLPKFAHGAAFALGERTVIGSYHVSQQNTQTGKLTVQMFDRIVTRCLGDAAREV
jgi:uracil-DNA glycosylase family 4